MFKYLKKVFSSTSAVTTVHIESVVAEMSREQSGMRGSDQIRGNNFLAEGKLAQAAICYRQAIAGSPSQIDGYISLGYVLTKLLQPEEAKQVLLQAISIGPSNTDAPYILAALARENGHQAEAIGYLEQVLALKPDFEAAYAELSDALSKCGRDIDAQSVIKRGISHYPRAPRFHFMLGALYAKSNNHDQAAASFLAALSLQPDLANLHHHLALSLFAQGRLDESVDRFRHAIQLNPDYPSAFAGLGAALLALGRFEDAIATYEREVQLEPKNITALVNKGIALHHLNRDEEALGSYDRALTLKPESPEALINRGVSLKELHRYQEALDCYLHANRLWPQDCDVLTNIGNALQCLNRHEEAIESFSKALCIKPESVNANLNLGLCCLQMGDFEMGWQKYEWRWKKDPLQNVRPAFSQPLWLGDKSLAGKTILLHAEQGLGDTVQFCRYAKLVSEQGAKVLLLIPKVLESLLSGLDGIDRVFTNSQDLPPFDYHCPLLSLPLACKTTVATVPCHIPYLNASTELVNRLRDELGTDKNLRIGVCWRGSTSYAGDAERSPGIAPFKRFMSRFVGRGLKFYTLLPDSRELFIQIGGEDLGYDLDQNSAPFVETAALIMNLDLIITCDTSIGHIAGALGKPVWLTVPFSTDWRWIRDRDDSPWYPQTRLFRQNAPGNWPELFDRVAVHLDAVLSGSSELIWSTGQSEDDPRNVQITAGN